MRMWLFSRTRAWGTAGKHPAIDGFWEAHGPLWISSNTSEVVVLFSPATLDSLQPNVADRDGSEENAGFRWKLSNIDRPISKERTFNWMISNEALRDYRDYLKNADLSSFSDNTGRFAPSDAVDQPLHLVKLTDRLPYCRQTSPYSFFRMNNA